jgi:hypothetical protein
MELYEVKDLPSSDLSNQHVDDDSNSEVNRLGVPKSKWFFFFVLPYSLWIAPFLGGRGMGGGGRHFMWQRIRMISFNFFLSNLFLMPFRFQFLFFSKEI